MEFKDAIKLDITKLDKAALEHPSLYDEWTVKWADAVSHRDRVKEQLSITRAEADMEIRKTPQKFGLATDKSPTEAWISNQIVLHEKVREANERLIEAQHDVNIFASAKETLDHRKKMLEILTDLYKGNYFSARSRSGERYEEAFDASQKDQEEVIGKNPRMDKKRRSRS